MNDFAWTALVTLLSLVVYILTIVRVGGARRRFNVPAPAMSGEPTFDRHFRVQMNTLESLPVFLPSLWLFEICWGDVWAASIGSLWIVGRLIYMVSYVADPKTRSLGFMTQGAASMVLLGGALWGVVETLLAGR